MCWITTRVESLVKEHNGVGYILVFEGVKEGITFHWTEAKELAVDKKPWLEHGLTMYSPGEIIEHIGNLMPLLFKGSWIEVVNWLNSYGKSPGLNWEELL